MCAVLRCIAELHCAVALCRPGRQLRQLRLRQELTRQRTPQPQPVTVLKTSSRNLMGRWVTACIGSSDRQGGQTQKERVTTGAARATFEPGHLAALLALPALHPQTRLPAPFAPACSRGRRGTWPRGRTRRPRAVSCTAARGRCRGSPAADIRGSQSEGAAAGSSYMRTGTQLLLHPACSVPAAAVRGFLSISQCAIGKVKHSRG
jgi:hypothetical protein